MSGKIEVVAYYKEQQVGTKEVEEYDFISEEFVKVTAPPWKMERFEVGNAPELPCQVICKIEEKGYFSCTLGKDYRYTRPSREGFTVSSQDLDYLAIGVVTHAIEKAAL